MAKCQIIERPPSTTAPIPAGHRWWYCKEHRVAWLTKGKGTPEKCYAPGAEAED